MVSRLATDKQMRILRISPDYRDLQEQAAPDITQPPPAVEQEATTDVCDHLDSPALLPALAQAMQQACEMLDSTGDATAVSYMVWIDRPSEAQDYLLDAAARLADEYSLRAEASSDGHFFTVRFSTCLDSN